MEIICFNFTSRMPFPYVIKIGRQLKGELFFQCLPLLSPLNAIVTASKKLTKLAWRLSIDRLVRVLLRFTTMNSFVAAAIGHLCHSNSHHM